MRLEIFENYYQPIEVEPEVEIEPIPEPVVEEYVPVKQSETQLFALNNRSALEKKWDENRPTPYKALEKIEKLPQPKANDENSIVAFKQQRKQIADDAINNSKPPKFADYLKLGLNGATASYEYQEAKTVYDSQISELKKISKDAVQFPKQILTPGEANVKIFKLPLPDRNNPAEIKNIQSNSRRYCRFGIDV